MKYEQKALWVAGEADVNKVNELLKEGFSFAGVVFSTPAGLSGFGGSMLMFEKEAACCGGPVDDDFFRLKSEKDEDLEEPKVKKTRKPRKKKEVAEVIDEVTPAIDGTV